MGMQLPPMPEDGEEPKQMSPEMADQIAQMAAASFTTVVNAEPTRSTSSTSTTTNARIQLFNYNSKNCKLNKVNCKEKLQKTSLTQC
jgi:hypothetical protein